MIRDGQRFPVGASHGIGELDQPKKGCEWGGGSVVQWQAEAQAYCSVGNE